MEQEVWQAVGRAFNELRDAFLGGEFQGINSKLDKTDHKLADVIFKLDNTEALIRREFQRVFQRIGSRMDNADRKLDKVAQNLDKTVRQESQKIGSRMDNTDGKLDSAAQSLERTEAFLQLESQRLNSRMDSTNDKLDNTGHKLDNAAQSLDKAEAFIQQESQRVSARLDNTDDKLDSTTESLRRTEIFMRKESQRMNSRMNNTDDKLKSTTQKIDGLDSKLNSLDIMMHNSKVVYLSQKILPLPSYDIATQQLLPVPEGFPSTALRLYNLRYRRNWRKLETILAYYHLESEVIRFAQFLDNPASNSDSDSDSKPNPKSTEFDLSSAIEFSPWGAVSILATHLGVDCDSLHSRIAQIESQHEGRIGLKRHLEGDIEVGAQPKRTIPLLRPPEDEWRRQITEAVKLESDTPGPAGEGEINQRKNTMVQWKSDSEEVKEHYQYIGYTQAGLEHEEGIGEERKSASGASADRA